MILIQTKQMVQTVWMKAKKQNEQSYKEKIRDTSKATGVGFPDNAPLT